MQNAEAENTGLTLPFQARHLNVEATAAHHVQQALIDAKCSM